MIMSVGLAGGLSVAVHDREDDDRRGHLAQHQRVRDLSSALLAQVTDVTRKQDQV